MKHLPKITLVLITLATLYACNKKEEMEAMRISSRHAGDTLQGQNPADTIFDWPVDTLTYSNPADTIVTTNPVDTTWQTNPENPYDTVWSHNPADTIRNQNPVDSQWTYVDSSVVFRHN